MNETREYYEEKLIAAEETIEELRERLAMAENELRERERESVSALLANQRKTVDPRCEAYLRQQAGLRNAHAPETPPSLETQCAWCAQEMGLAPGERGSTGACERHRAEVIAQAFADRESERSGKRRDQVLFSGAVLLLALAIGVLAGAWLAVARYGGMGVLR